MEATDGLKRMPIHLACEEELPHVLRVLLDAGSPVDTLDGQRRTPLLIATRAGSLELCEAKLRSVLRTWQVLLSWGADPNWGETARGIPSALALTRRGNDPALRGLMEDLWRKGRIFQGASHYEQDII